MSDARAELRAQMIEFNNRYKKLAAGMEEMERRRGVLYAAGKESDPPMTFRELAEIFEVTQSAVMQKLKRHYESLGVAVADEVAGAVLAS